MTSEQELKFSRLEERIELLETTLCATTYVLEKVIEAIEEMNKNLFMLTSTSEKLP